MRVVWIYVLTILALCNLAYSKFIQGTIHLTSENTEAFLGRFSFDQSGLIEANLAISETQPPGVKNAKTYYDNRPRQLMVALYDDKSWQKYNQLVKEGSLCRERLGHSNARFPIRPSRDNPEAPVGKTFYFKHVVQQPTSAMYMFVTVMDCALEEYPANPPAMDFEIVFTNNGSHLPADETYSLYVFVLGLIMFGGIAAVYLVFYQALMNKYHCRHLLNVLVGAAIVCQVGSLIMQIAHNLVYQSNGMGLKQRYVGFIGAFDFYSEMLGLGSELLVAFTLICVSLGWTLTPNFKMSSLLQPSRLCFIIAFGLLHLWLQWCGRKYEEDFTYFHDFSHWPGTVLLCLRVLLLCIFFTAMQFAYGYVPFYISKCPPLALIFTRIGAIVKSTDGTYRSVGISTDSHTQSIIKQLTIVGCVWFAIFPCSVILSYLLPPIHRRLPIVLSSMVVHACTILCMVWATMRPDSTFFESSSLKSLGSVLDSGVSNNFRFSKTAID